MTGSGDESGVELVLTSAEEGQAIRNLWPLYLHDIAAYERRVPNRHGILHDSDEVESWDAVLTPTSAWWTQPGVLFPYLIRAEGVPAGFCLVASGGYVTTEGVDLMVYEFFVLHAFRGDGTAGAAVRRALALHRGSWEIATWTSAPRAQAFWRKTLPACAQGEVTETEEDLSIGHRIVFRFES